MTVLTRDQFTARVAEIESDAAYTRPLAFGIGLAHYGITDFENPAAWNADQKVLDTYYPLVNYQENLATAAILADAVAHKQGTAAYLLSDEQLGAVLEQFSAFADDGKPHQNIDILKRFQHANQGLDKPQRVVVSFLQDSNDPIESVYDAYLRLHLISQRKVQPHGVGLDGIFGALNNVVWTDQGPFDPDNFEALRSYLLGQGKVLGVRSIDKFPRLTDYVIPSGVRIADADRVRLGAHLADGTTIMHEGFVNFNAGTLGHSMVEGRISAGVVVDDGSDVGGGASIMGTLSGGGKQTIRIGKQCLLGANSGLGVSLGDECTIEAGLYVTAGSKVMCTWDGEIRKAAELSGESGLLFRRHSISGSIEVVRKKNEVTLNSALHSND